MQVSSNNPIQGGYLDNSISTPTPTYRSAPHTTIQDQPIWHNVVIVTTPKLGRRIRLKLTAAERRQYKDTYVIYCIKRTDGKCYIGKTCNIAKRFHAWNYAINNPESQNGQCSLAKGIRKDYTAYKWCILEKCKEEEVDAAESRHIEEISKTGRLFNKCGGGGGGLRYTPIVSDKPIPEEFPTPKKQYTIANEKGRLKVNLTPTGRKARNAVYQFAHKEKRIKLIGAANSVQKRMYSYNHKLNNNKENSLALAIQQSPDKWNVSILYQGGDERAAEKAAIKSKSSQPGTTLLNKSGGGEGPGASVRKRLFCEGEGPGPSKRKKLF